MPTRDAGEFGGLPGAYMGGRSWRVVAHESGRSWGGMYFQGRVMIVSGCVRFQCGIVCGEAVFVFQGGP